MDKVPLTPAPYRVFSALINALEEQAYLPESERSVEYNRLKSLSGMDSTRCFPKHIQELAAKGVVLCLGPHNNRLVTLRIDPRLVEPVDRYGIGDALHSRPIKSPPKTRRCLCCRRSFKGDGYWICFLCKKGDDFSGTRSATGIPYIFDMQGISELARDFEPEFGFKEYLPEFGLPDDSPDRLHDLREFGL